jgi:hypothetical protein
VILIKSMTARGVLCALILSFLVSATTSRSTASPVQEVPITGGRIQGVLKDTVVSFKGIPFAAPPSAHCAGNRLDRSTPGEESAKRIALHGPVRKEKETMITPRVKTAGI